MKYIKVLNSNALYNINGKIVDAVRYVRVDLFDEFVVKGEDVIREGGESKFEFKVEGIVYSQEENEDWRYYELKWFDTFEEAEAYLENLIAELNAEET